MSDQADDLLTLVVKTYTDKKEIKVKVSPADTLSDVKNQLVEIHASTQPFSCYSFAKEDQPDDKLDFYIPVGEILENESVIKIVPDSYTEAESISHINRVRDILGFDIERANSQSINAGGSLFDPVAKLVVKADESKHVEQDIDTENMTEDQIREAQSTRLSNRPTVLDHPLATDLEKDSIKLASVDSPLAFKTAVRSLHLSQWNPPPPTLRMKGHLLYLQVGTLEGKSFQITSTTEGYHVSNCSGEKFDPSPKKGSNKSVCLLTLLKSLSPSIGQALNSAADLLKANEPLLLTRPTNTFLANPWLVQEPNAKNLQQPDLARTQDKFSKSSDNHLRDWNEDLQSAREMPHGSEDLNNKVIRERLLNKLSFDFAEAAVKTAKAIVHGELQPLNPSEPKDAQIFLHNNMFFSFGSDGIGTFANEGGDAAARAAAGKDLAGVNYVNQLDVDGLCQLCTVIVDYCGRRVICQGPVPGIFRENQESQIVYGSVDNREKIERNDSFEPMMQVIADACHLKPHMAYDINGENGHELVTAMDCKGLEGTDGRNYVLDLYRITPSDLAFIEKYSSTKEKAPYPHRMAVLRAEAVDEWFRSHVREYLQEQNLKLEKDQEKEGSEDNDEEKREKLRSQQEEAIKKLQKELRLNPDVAIDPTTLPKSAQEQFQKDQQEVRKVCEMVTDKIIPKFVADIHEGLLTTPLDGAHLTQLMHRKGINMRYLGLIYEILTTQYKGKLEVFESLVLKEAVSRSIKHIWNKHVQGLSFENVSAFGAGFFNAVFGHTGSKDSTCGLGVDEMAQEITFEVLSRFRIEVTSYSDLLNSMDKKSLFREITKKIGLQWRSREYSFDDFSADDLLNVVPVVRSSTFKSQLAEDAMEAGRMAIVRGERDTGVQLIFEALSLFEQVYGLMSASTGHAYSAASTIYNEMKEYGMACELSRKAIYILERTSGADSHETLYALLNLAVHEHQNGNTIGVLHIVKHAMQLWQVVSGPDHPDSLTTMLNVSSALQILKDYAGSLLWRERALELAEKIFSSESEDKESDNHSITIAQIQNQLSEAYTLTQQWDKAVESAKKSHELFSKQLGDDHESTKDVKKWIDMLEPAAKQYAQNAANATQMDAATLAAAQRRQVTQHRAMGAANGSSHRQVPQQKTDNLASARRTQNADKSVDELMDYINGTAPSTKKKNKKGKKGAKK